MLRPLRPLGALGFRPARGGHRGRRYGPKVVLLRIRRSVWERGQTGRSRSCKSRVWMDTRQTRRRLFYEPFLRFVITHDRSTCPLTLTDTVSR